MSENLIPNTGLQLNFSLDNIIMFLASLSPIFITLFFLLRSVSNLEPSGFFWFGAVSITLFFSYLFKGFLKIEKPGQYANVNFCSVFRDPFELTIGRFTAPSFHMTFHSFTLAYLAWDVFNNPHRGGLILWCLLLFIALIDGSYRLKNLCENFISLVIGIILGGVSGFISSFAVSFIGTNDDGKGKFKFNLFGKKLDPSKCSIKNRKYSCKIKKK